MIQKRAFTMIEVIFVIVIIGVLASIALPRLAATRTDAEITICVDQTKQFLKDMMGYYLAKGYLTNISKMSNVPIMNGRKKQNGFEKDWDFGVKKSIAKGFYCNGEVSTSFAVSHKKDGSLHINVYDKSSGDGIGKQVADVLSKNGFYHDYRL